MATIISDAFTDTNGTALQSHTPTTAGSSWTRISTLSATGVNLECNSNELDYGNGGLSVTATYTAEGTYSSADYFVSVDSVFTGAADEPVILIARYQDVDNFYALYFNDTYFELHRVLSGTPSIIGADQGGVVSNGVIVKLQCDGDSITTYTNSTQRHNVTDSNISSAGKAGISFGDLLYAGDDMTEAIVDDYLVETLETTYTKNNSAKANIITTYYSGNNYSWKPSTEEAPNRGYNS